NVLIIKGDSPIGSVRELANYCRQNPARANFSSAGSGTSSHLAGVLFGMRMGIEVQHVPYRGTAPSMAAVLNGETLFAIGAAPSSRQQVLGGLLKALGVSTAQRSSTMPEVPTLQEQGVPDFDVSSWYGVTAPAGVPMAIRERLGAEVVAALQDAAIAQRVRDFGAEPWPLGPADYDSFMRREVAVWAPIVQASGAQID
ncbi:MAG: Bug family tripartite tricarboxylate transporter substrate binding protein, partial [Alphaproteobacteria bacterium]